MQFRQMLRDDAVYYVRSDGNDANDGLTDTPRGAFRSFQRAVDVVSLLDFGGRSVTIQAGDEVGHVVFDAGVRLGPLIGGRVLFIKGNGSARTTIMNSGGDAFTQIVTGPTAVQYSGMRLCAAGTGVKTAYQSLALFGEDMWFGGFGDRAIWVHDQQSIAQSLNCRFSVSGGMEAFLFVQYGHAFIENCDVHIVDVPEWKQAFIETFPRGTVQWIGNRIHNGSASLGSRASINHQSILNLGGSPLESLPGSSNGKIDGTSLVL